MIHFEQFSFIFVLNFHNFSKISIEFQKRGPRWATVGHGGPRVGHAFFEKCVGQAFVGHAALYIGPRGPRLPPRGPRWPTVAHRGPRFWDSSNFLEIFEIFLKKVKFYLENYLKELKIIFINFYNIFD